MENQLSAKELYEAGPAPGQTVASHVAQLYAAVARAKSSGGETLQVTDDVLAQAGGAIATQDYHLTYVDQPHPTVAV